MNKKTLLTLFLALLLGVGVGFLFYSYPKMTENTKQRIEDKSNFENSDSGLENNLATSTQTPGENRIEGENSSEQRNENIWKLTIIEDQKVQSPVVIEGEARGTWFFEGKFPVYVVDINNKVIGTGSATAKGDWMTEDFVPFIATVDFTSGAAESGFIVLEKSNPSGLPEKNEIKKLPVKFSQQVNARETGGCKVTGCSGQVCSDQDVVTDCAYREEYICYQKAKCERQSDGQCGWTETKELQMCVQQFE